MATKVRIVIERPVAYEYVSQYEKTADGKPAVQSRIDNTRVLELQIETSEPNKLEYMIQQTILDFRREVQE